MTGNRCFIQRVAPFAAGIVRASVTSLIVIACATGGGCKSKHAATAPGYSTIAQDPNRDTERAKSENTKGVEQVEKAEWDKAEKTFKAAIEADVTFGPAHNNLGRVYYQQGKYYLAAWEFQYAIKLMPDQAQPHSNLGLVLEQTGKLDEAIVQYDQALAMDPHDPQIIGNDVRARIRRGESDERVKMLLKELVARDTRPEWVSWAKERLALFKPVAASPTTAPNIP